MTLNNSNKNSKDFNKEFKRSDKRTRNLITHILISTETPQANSTKRLWRNLTKSRRNKKEWEVHRWKIPWMITHTAKFRKRMKTICSCKIIPFCLREKNSKTSRTISTALKNKRMKNWRESMVNGNCLRSRLRAKTMFHPTRFRFPRTTKTLLKISSIKKPPSKVNFPPASPHLPSRKQQKIRQKLSQNSKDYQKCLELRHQNQTKSLPHKINFIRQQGTSFKRCKARNSTKKIRKWRIQIRRTLTNLLTVQHKTSFIGLLLVSRSILLTICLKCRTDLTTKEMKI